MKQISDEATTHPIWVAFADDHLLLRESLVSHIETDGDIKVSLQAENGKDLIEQLKRSDTIPDVCLLDIMMPELDGFQTVEQLKSLWPDMKILILTSYLHDIYVIQMISAGVNGYLTKSSHPRTVREAIRHVMEYDIYCNEQFCLKDIKAVKEGRLELPRLTEKELQLLRYCIEDLTYLEIADKMETTQKSVEGYRNKLFQKLNTKSRTGLALYAVRNGYVPIDFVKLPRN